MSAEIRTIVRALINDPAPPDANNVYSDTKINDLISVAARYVVIDLNLDQEYKIDVVTNTITPDPTGVNTRDETFISFVALRASCFLDQSTYRTRAATEGIKAGLGPAQLNVSGNLSGYKNIIDIGPCGVYEYLKQQHNIGNATAISAVLSPFAGNNFDPRFLFVADLPARSTRDGFYT
jgi:hypothetical protein|tara:strand:- start:1428 stop:1964 length:537 start_codon:yes stop_codon:yes gene_type:complete